VDEAPEPIRGRPGFHFDPRLANSPSWEPLKRVLREWSLHRARQVVRTVEGGNFHTLEGVSRPDINRLLEMIRHAGLEGRVGYRADI
jgi:hypothetical protein